MPGLSFLRPTVPGGGLAAVLLRDTSHDTFLWLENVFGRRAYRLKSTLEPDPLPFCQTVKLRLDHY